MTTEPTAKHQQEARELMCGPRAEGESAWLLKGDLADLHGRIATALSSRDQEIREVLEGLATHQIGSRRPCWCPSDYESEPHSPACLAARGLWERVQGTVNEEESDVDK